MRLESHPECRKKEHHIHNLVPRVFLRHTLITKPNEHPGTLRSHLPKKWANVEAIMNFGNKWQIMVGIGKEYGFKLNFDMPRSFTQCKSELRPKMANSQSDCRTATCIPE